MNAERDSCLLRALSPIRGWEPQSAKVFDVTAWLRAFFADEAMDFTSKSLKPTVLGWTARYGIPLPDRRTLGYYVKPKDRQVTIYSRDELPVPLRALQILYADISGGKFKPDETRSGQWAVLMKGLTPLVSSASSVSSGSSTSDECETAVACRDALFPVSTECTPAQNSTSSSSSSSSSSGTGSSENGNALED